MPNPWSDVESAQAAAEGAGLDSFDVPEDATISLGKVNVTSYRCMDGIAEAVCEFPAVEMTIRKGTSAVAQDGDISGDYNSYEYEWPLTLKGLMVNCAGHSENAANKVLWVAHDDAYCILADGAGLSPDDINSLINAIQ